MRPPLALDRRMRVAILIRVLVMNAVRRDPENRSAFERERGADGQEVLHPLRSLVATVREQPMISHADTQAARNPPQEHGDEQSLPCEEEKRRHRAHVKQAHEDRGHPVHFTVCRLPFFQAFQLHIQSGSSFGWFSNPLPPDLTYQGIGLNHCNTCVIAGWAAITEVPEEGNKRGRTGSAPRNEQNYESLIRSNSQAHFVI